MSLKQALLGIAWLAATCAPAAAQKLDPEAGQILLMVGQVEGCAATDATLRKMCAKSGPSAPESIRQSCELPSMPYAARTAGPLRQFKETFADVWKKAEPHYQDIVGQGLADQRRRHDELLATRQWSSTQLHMLHADMRDCDRAAKLLSARPRRN